MIGRPVTGRTADEVTDVVVVGGGLAGLSAALEAASVGAEVVVCEKEADPGGSTVLSGGFFALAGTPLQRGLGIEDTPERLFDDLVDVGGGYADENLLRRYVEGVGELHEWLARRQAFTSVHLGAGQSVPRSHIGDIRALFARLVDEVDACPRISIRTRTPVHRLVRAPGGGGPVEGVVVGAREAATTLAVRRGAVLTSGGFSRSADLLRTFAPDQADAMRIGGAGNTGDGLRMAWALGADVRDMGQIKGTFGNHPGPTERPHELLLAFYLGAIIVNRHGRRFVDESLSYKLLGDACLAQPGAECFQLLDQAVLDRAPRGVPLYDLEEARQRGLLVSAPTWEELAGAVGIPPTALTATVERYNRDVVTGHDTELGRRGLGHVAGDLVALDTPPFHAFRSTSALLATYCGLRITPDAQVVDVFGDPVTGLHAAGEVTGGFHGRAYMTGSSLGKAVAFGRIAGGRAASTGGTSP